MFSTVYVKFSQSLYILLLLQCVKKAEAYIQQALQDTYSPRPAAIPDAHGWKQTVLCRLF